MKGEFPCHTQRGGLQAKVTDLHDSPSAQRKGCPGPTFRGPEPPRLGTGGRTRILADPSPSRGMLLGGVPITRHTVNKIKIARRSCYLHGALYNGLPTCFLCYYYSPAIPPLREQADRSQSPHFYHDSRSYGRGRRLAARCNSHFNLPRKHPHGTDGKGGGKGVIYSSAPGALPPF